MKRFGISLWILILINSISLVGVGAPYNKQTSSEELQQIKQKLDDPENYKEALTLSLSAVKKYRGDVDFLFLLGRSYFLTRNYTQAQKTFDQVIQKAPKYKDAYVAAANVQLANHSNWKAMLYTNRGLAYFPGDRDLELKKFDILLQQGNRTGAISQTEHLVSLFPNDAEIIKSCVTFYDGQGDLYLKQRNFSQASEAYGKALKLDSENMQALQGISFAHQNLGDDLNSLAFLNRALAQDPNSYDLLWKKAIVLSNQKKYQEAIEVVNNILKKYPKDRKAKSFLFDLKLGAARYYKKNDSYYWYADIIKNYPGNAEALNNVISISLERGAYNEALGWINQALKKNPSNKNRLEQKLMILQQQQMYGAASVIAEKILKLNPKNLGIKEELIQLYYKIGHDYGGEQSYDKALEFYKKMLKLDPYNREALQGSINMLLAEKEYQAALHVVDNALMKYPEDSNFLELKASILQSDNQLTESLYCWNKLRKRFPQNVKYINNYTDVALAKGRQLMQIEDYERASEVYNDILTIQPDNREALNNRLNVELSMHKEGSLVAKNIADQSLKYYSQDLEFWLKKSDVLFRMQSYNEAVSITDSLRICYPYNQKIKNVYLEQLHKMAIIANQKGDASSVVNIYDRILKTTANDSIAMLGKVNLYVLEGDYNQAFETTNQALAYYPGNATLLMKRAQILEQRKQYREAYTDAKLVAGIYSERKSFQDYASYLQSKTFHNMIMLSYLNSRIDSSHNANVASLQYSRYGEKGIYTGRLNFAGRDTGTGIQGEFETYYNHSPSWYSYLDLGIANTVVFPKWKAAYSLFHNFSKGWEGELGGRFMRFSSLSSYSGVASIGKYLGDFWLNVRNYTTSVSGNIYEADILTIRQYLNNKTDFFYASLGYGNSPDDYSRSYELINYIKYRTYSVGSGFQLMLNYRNFISLNGTWYSQKIYESVYHNQYDVYVSFSRKF